MNRPADAVDYVYRPASDSYRRRAKSVVTAALNDAIEQGHVARNVGSLAKVRKADLAHEGRTLTTAQVATLLDHVYGHPLEVFVVAGITLGLRGGETCALRWGDVNFRAGTIAISGTLVREGSRLV